MGRGRLHEGRGIWGMDLVPVMGKVQTSTAGGRETSQEPGRMTWSAGFRLFKGAEFHCGALHGEGRTQKMKIPLPVTMVFPSKLITRVPEWNSRSIPTPAFSSRRN